MQTKQERIKSLFKSRILFEKEVLNVNGDQDREEIVHILAISFVGDILKEHINFLYIQNLSDFTLKPIVNLIFKEMASEWVDYAMHELEYSKNEALEELRIDNRVQFLRILADDYYKHYKDCIFEEIVDSFIELLVLNSDKNEKSRIINAVINSSLVPNRSVLGINSSDQLCKRAKAAKDLKNEKVAELQFKLAEIGEGMKDAKISQSKREDLSLVYPNYVKKLQAIKELKLEKFDDGLQRLKRAIISSLQVHQHIKLY